MLCNASRKYRSPLKTGTIQLIRAGVTPMLPVSQERLLRGFVVWLFPGEVLQARSGRIEGQQVAHVTIDVELRSFVRQFVLALGSPDLLWWCPVLCDQQEIFLEKLRCHALNVGLRLFS